MFDEDFIPKKKTGEMPRNLERLSTEELAEYILDLEAEIERVRRDMDRKALSKAAADNVFKN